MVGSGGHIFNPTGEPLAVIDAAGEVYAGERCLSGIVFCDDAVAATRLNRPGKGSVKRCSCRAASAEIAQGYPPVVQRWTGPFVSLPTHNVEA
jgi:hypothetical protein